MRLKIKNARLLDPGNNIDRIGDIFVSEGIIAGLGDCGDVCSDHEFDAFGMVASPAFLDLHVHTRDPGYTYKEDIATALSAAAAGGFGGICAMPNTDPAADSPEIIKYMIKRAGEVSSVRLYPIAAATLGSKGEELSDYSALKAAGAVAVSDDGRPVSTARLMRDSMELASRCGLAVTSHCEDLSLAAGGALNEGEVSRELGLLGIPAAAEEIGTARDLIICAQTLLPLHICHVSTKRAVEMIRIAKGAGLPVTAETCPHYFSLTDREALRIGSYAKVNPPLRSREDVQAVIDGLCDGTLDVIATDHAPHAKQEKERPFASAMSGLIGLQTALPAALTYLYHAGYMGLTDIVEKMTVNARRAFGLPYQGFAVGASADICVFDPNLRFVFEKTMILSRSDNSPYIGKEFIGAPVLTVAQGEIVYRR